ncbi:MAG: F0F1 ATP synthase subunit A [Candidatus Kerfeldbacteria bacterium]|nr:F0F1 ATP synthase subunit A [Candidatus Kerfeldbacteria bacterium]
MDISLAAEPILEIGHIEITNSLITSLLVTVLLLCFVFFLNKKGLKQVPRGVQNVVEIIFEGLFNLMKGVTGDEKRARRFFPLVATFFIVIILSNYFGLLPFVGSIGFHEVHEGKELFVPLFRSANSDLNTTLALALVSVISTHVLGVTALGFWKHTGKFVNFKLLLKSPIMFAVGILEIFGEISKVVSFSFRLFGNIFAGEVLLVVMGTLVAFVAPVPFYLLELFVGFIQALVFAMLTLVFLTMATEESHH